MRLSLLMAVVILCAAPPSAAAAALPAIQKEPVCQVSARSLGDAYQAQEGSQITLTLTVSCDREADVTLTLDGGALAGLSLIGPGGGTLRTASVGVPSQRLRVTPQRPASLSWALALPRGQWVNDGEYRAELTVTVSTSTP